MGSLTRPPAPSLGTPLTILLRGTACSPSSSLSSPEMLLSWVNLWSWILGCSCSTPYVGVWKQEGQLVKKRCRSSSAFLRGRARQAIPLIVSVFFPLNVCASFTSSLDLLNTLNQRLILTHFSDTVFAYGDGPSRGSGECNCWNPTHCKQCTLVVNLMCALCKSGGQSRKT